MPAHLTLLYAGKIAKNEARKALRKQPLLEYILHDRTLRIDQKTPVASRPPFATIFVENSVIVRLEFYMGHDKLAQIIDLRSNHLRDKSLPKSFPNDSLALDPMENVRSLAALECLYGIPFPVTLLPTMHIALLCDYHVVTLEPDPALDSRSKPQLIKSSQTLQYVYEQFSESISQAASAMDTEGGAL